ncbi:MAG: hypothetical protein HY525_03045 [Betaproteobacteria bacterium]|nr:hypothetical protein [Betaproteobacteria bacterium]
MKRKTPIARHPDADRIRARLLRGIAGNRIAGLHFPGYFLDIEWEEITGDSARIAIADGPHCRNASGEVDIAALGILTDTALATTTRRGITPGAWLATTIHLQMQLTGAPATGSISASARLLDFSAGSALRQLLCSAVLSARGQPVCHASGEFVLFDPPPGVKFGPLPWLHAAPPQIAPVEESALDPRERAILKACDGALAKASPQAAFIQHFWGGAPKYTAHGASNRVAIGAHLCNRVGDVQGGILFGIAAHTAAAAVPAGMMLSNVSAWYIGPGRGKALAVKSRVVHAGRTIAVVRTEIKTSSGKRVLEAVTHHVAKAR